MRFKPAKACTDSHSALPQGHPGPDREIDRAGPSPYFSGMAKLDIIKLPDPLLRRASKPVERVDAELRKLADDMLKTMYAAPGVGLAAVQVGVPRRLIVLDTSEKEAEPAPLVLINPEIVSLGSELRVHEEGCLSIPEYYEEVERPIAVKVRYLDLDGKEHKLFAENEGKALLVVFWSYRDPVSRFYAPALAELQDKYEGKLAIYLVNSNQMRVLGRWMRMITIPNQSSVAKAFQEFDEAGRMKPSAYYERVVDVMEELMKFTLLTRDVAPYLVDRYSERRESAAELSKRVNQRSI